MRNYLVYLFIIAILPTLLGCAGGKATPVETAAPQQEEAPAAPPTPASNFTQPLSPDQQLVKDILKKNGFPCKGLAPTIVVVNKLSRKLTVYQGLTPLKTYPVVLGADPYNDKLCHGDQCTPEGVYRVVTKFPHPKWSRFILLDYPNDQNWLKFGQAKNAGKLPPEADIGGQVGIHGTADELKNIRGENWTKGCISLLNQHVEELYSQINDNTLIIIKKR